MPRELNTPPMRTDGDAIVLAVGVAGGRVTVAGGTHARDKLVHARDKLVRVGGVTPGEAAERLGLAQRAPR